MPRIETGEEVDFRAVVYVEKRGHLEPVRGGQFLVWMASGGDALAVILTRAGETTVRWSMIAGVDSPEGLLDD